MKEAIHKIMFLMINHGKLMPFLCVIVIVRHKSYPIYGVMGSFRLNLPIYRSARAGDGIRTREYQLGRLMPYHLATPAYLCYYRLCSLRSECHFTTLFYSLYSAHNPSTGPGFS